jgi:hypothetical protein
MNEDNSNQVNQPNHAALVPVELGVSYAENLTEEEVLHLVAARVSELMAHQFEFLMGMLYRLDVLEEKIKVALSPQNPEAPDIALARLIIERQKQRLKSKLNSFKPLPDDMQDLAW